MLVNIDAEERCQIYPLLELLSRFNRPDINLVKPEQFAFAMLTSSGRMRSPPEISRESSSGLAARCTKGRRFYFAQASSAVIYAYSGFAIKSCT